MDVIKYMHSFLCMQQLLVTEQALDCITRLINHDFDHKPWNKSHKFDMHITPKKNMSFSLKEERFNHLPLTCAVTLYHSFDDVASFSACDQPIGMHCRMFSRS